MLVSWGCQDKVPATDGGLNQQTFIPSQFWGQKSDPGVGRATLLLKALGEGPRCLFQLLVAPGIPGLMATSPVSASHHVAVSPLYVYVSAFLSLIRTLLIGFRPALIQDDLILTWLHLQSLFPNKVIL